MATAYVEYPLSGQHGEGLHTKVDPDTHEWLGGRRVHIGDGYARCHTPETIKAQSSAVRLHRIVLGLDQGDDRSVDHINRDRLDNRRANLRIASPSQNSHNITGRGGPFTRNTYRARGRERWQAKVNVAGKTHQVGQFDTRIEAWWAAEEWKRRHIKGYIPQNF